MKTGTGRILDPNLRSKTVESFENALKHKVIGQDSAVEALVDIFQMFSAGLNPPNRPIGNLLFLGPTGTGKTKTVEAVAEILFGDEHALIKVDCAEFQHSHEIAKLIGSPPGYLGHRETHPVFTQEAINQWHTDKLKLTLVLFDEIEKASDALWQLLLGILDKGTLTLGDNRHTNMSNCIIIMTSNIGADEINSLVNKRIGFQVPHSDSNLNEKIERIAINSARRKFTPEFMNRIDKSVVFQTLTSDHLRQILELELKAVQQRIIQSSGDTQFIFECTDQVKHYLLEHGTDQRYGARHLKRVIEKSIVFPLSNLIATNQINIGDFIRISLDGEFVFTVESENAVVPIMLAKFKNLGLTTARNLPEAEPSAAMKRARKKLKEAEDKLAEAKAMRKELEALDDEDADKK